MRTEFLRHFTPLRNFSSQAVVTWSDAGVFLLIFGRSSQWQALDYSIIIIYYCIIIMNACYIINPLNHELNPVCYLLALLGAHHFLHVSRIRVKLREFKKNGKPEWKYTVYQKLCQWVYVTNQFPPINTYTSYLNHNFPHESTQLQLTHGNIRRYGLLKISVYFASFSRIN